MLVQTYKKKNIQESVNSFSSYLGSNVTESFFITPVTEAEIERELVKLNPNKSCGFDDIHPKVIREIAHLIKQPLKIIYNNSLTTGIIPDQLKVSLMTPIYKSDDETLFPNCRPVAVLPCFSKILEKLKL